MAEEASFFKTMKEFLHKPKSVKPHGVLPFIKTDLKKLRDDNSSLVWFGHSSYLLKIEGRTILADPIFSGNAAPVSFMVKSFAGANEYKPEDFPKIDILLLTHDHFDYKTILKLKTKVNQVVCSLGVGSHLEHWGFKAETIHELDWWENQKTEGFDFTATPGRHFFGKRNKTQTKFMVGVYFKNKKLQIISWWRFRIRFAL